MPAPSATSGWELVKPTQTQPSPAPAPAPAAPAATTTTTAVTATKRKAAPARHAVVPSRLHRLRPERQVVRPQRTGAVLAAKATASRPPYEQILLVAALGLAIACFTFGAVPAAQIRWPRGAAFVADHRTNITLAGAMCLLAAAVVFVLTQH